MAANSPLPFPAKTLTIEIETAEAETVVKCRGRITADTSEPLKQKVKQLLIEQHKHIILDLGEVNHVDSSGLGTLLSLYISAKAANSDLKLIHLNERVTELLRISKLGAVFEGYTRL